LKEQTESLPKISSIFEFIYFMHLSSDGSRRRGARNETLKGGPRKEKDKSIL